MALPNVAEVIGAENSAERALALAPDDALASYALGMGLKKLGDPGAERWLSRASALSPSVRVALDSSR